MTHLMASLDEALARHCEKWMKLSKPKLREFGSTRWSAQFDPAGARVPSRGRSRHSLLSTIDEAGPRCGLCAGSPARHRRGLH